MMGKQGSIFRKNPFPAIAHASRLGPEISTLTVVTGRFSKTLELATSRSIGEQAVVLIVVGEAGSGKTHFLRFLESKYKNDRTYSKVKYLQTPGDSFTQLIASILDKVFDQAALKQTVYRLIAFPVIEVCKSKARADRAAAKDNRDLIKILSKNPERVFAYWDRFSKSEIFNASLMSLERVSKSDLFYTLIEELLRDIRDERQVDFAEVHDKLSYPDSWKVPGEPDSDHGAIRMLESVFALYDLLEIRLMIFVDECQYLLNMDEQAAKNDLFRQLVNAAPRGSVFAFAMRTSDWIAFRDPATERRVLYSKIEVDFEEACSILRKYIRIKSGTGRMTMELASEYFDDEVIKRIWQAANRVIGKTLRLSYLVVERVIAGGGAISIDSAVDELTSDKAELDADQQSRDIRVQLEDAVNALELPLAVRKNYDNFDYALFAEQTVEPRLVIGLLEAADDQDEAKLAYKMLKRFQELSRNYTGVGMFVVRAGYASSTVNRLLESISEGVYDSQLHSAPLGARLEELAERRQQYPSSTPDEKIREVLEQLEFVIGDRGREDLRLQQAVSAGPARAKPARREALRYSSPIFLMSLMLVTGILLMGSYWIFESNRKSDEIQINAEFEQALNKLANDNSGIRSSGVRALERLAETARVNLGIQEVLVAHVVDRVDRMRSNDSKRLPPDVGIALEVLAGQDSWRTGNSNPVSFANNNLGSLSLSGLQTRNWDFSGVIFERAQAIDAAFLDADFRRADISYSNLRGANLAGASFEDAQLRGVDLAGADLSGVDFTGAILQDANLDGAVLAEANFAGATLDSISLSLDQLVNAGAIVTSTTKFHRREINPNPEVN